MRVYAGDLVMGEFNEPYIVASVQGGFHLISLKDGNRWSDCLLTKTPDVVSGRTYVLLETINREYSSSSMWTKVNKHMELP